MGTRQGDLFAKPLLSLAYFLALWAYNIVFPSYIFLSLINDTHIFNPTSLIPFIFDHFASLLA
jgi:hypothetical protein